MSESGELTAIIQSAIDAGDVAGAVGVAVRGDGTIVAEAVGGLANVETGAAMTRDSFFRLFSMSKAVGSTAAALLIHDGKLDADTPVGDILPEFNQLQVLDGFDGDTPQLRAPNSPCTVKHLATHTSGLVYDIWTEKMVKVTEQGATSVLSGLRSSLLESPMMFDPGTQWAYGIGIDWLTVVVEKVSGQTIESFVDERIFKPLAMTDTAFERDGREDRLVGIAIRGEDGSLGPMPDIGPPPSPEFYGMGHALLGSADDYLRFLRMFLNDGTLDGNQVLTPETIDWMFQNHIGDLEIGAMSTTNPVMSADVDFLNGAPKKHSFGFVTNTADIDGMRRAGSQSWAGVLNTHMWVDPAADVAAVLLTQQLPFADPRVMSLYEAFERQVYADLT